MRRVTFTFWFRSKSFNIRTVRCYLDNKTYGCYSNVRSTASYIIIVLPENHPTGVLFDLIFDNHVPHPFTDSSDNPLPNYDTESGSMKYRTRTFSYQKICDLFDFSSK